MPMGAQALSSLTGSEAVVMDNGGATIVTGTTQQIANLAAGTSTTGVVTTISTVGAGSLTAASIIGRNINRTGVQVAAFTDTTVSAATIIAALPSGAPVGTSFLLSYSNNQTGAAGYVATIAGGTGVTVSGITAVPTGGTAEYLVTYTAANTVTMVGRFEAQSISTQVNIAGSTSGQLTLKPTAVSGTSVITFPAATDTVAVLGTAQTWTAAQTFTNSDILLLGSSTGATTFTSLNAGATNYTLSLVASTGVIAQTTGANLFVTDVYRTSAPVTKNANVTPITVPGLAGTVAVGTYRFRAYLPSTVASGTGGIAYSFLLTTAVLGVMECSGSGYTSAAVAVQHTTTATSGTAVFTQAAVVIQTLLEGTFTVTTAGTFTIQMCQNTSNASDTVALVGGYLELVRIA